LKFTSRAARAEVVSSKLFLELFHSAAKRPESRALHGFQKRKPRRRLLLRTNIGWSSSWNFTVVLLCDELAPATSRKDRESITQQLRAKDGVAPNLLSEIYFTPSASSFPLRFAPFICLPVLSSARRRSSFRCLISSILCASIFSLPSEVGW
jgi:hypothetical protein